MQKQKNKTEIREILKIVKKNSAELRSVSKAVKDNKAEIRSVLKLAEENKGEIQSVLKLAEENKGEIQSVLKLAEENKGEIQSVLEIVNFIKDNAASQEGVDALAEKVSGIESRMVTKEYFKEYLDDKSADLRGDLVVLTRKEDVKVRALVEIMAQKKLLSKEEVNKILSMEPFPQLAL